MMKLMLNGGKTIHVNPLAVSHVIENRDRAFSTIYFIGNENGVFVHDPSGIVAARISEAMRVPPSDHTGKR
jgi:hypothetical protein